MIRLARAVSARMHFAWIVLGLAFMTLLMTAAVRVTPSVLIVPLEQAFGWSPATISFAISLNLVLYGALGPFGAALMQRFGIRGALRTDLGSYVTPFLLSGTLCLCAAIFVLWIGGAKRGAGARRLAPAT